MTLLDVQHVKKIYKTRFKGNQVLSSHHGGRTIQKRVIKINEKLTLGWLFYVT